MTRLRIVLPIVLLALTLQPAHAQQSTDEAAIRAVLARETEGWNKFDPKEVVSTFTEDAIWQNPFGVRLHGRAELEKFLTDLLARPGFRAGTSTAPTSAVVWSDERIDGLINDLSGHPMQPRHSYYLKVLVKKDGEWKISDALIMDIVHPK